MPGEMAADASLTAVEETKRVIKSDLNAVVTASRYWILGLNSSIICMKRLVSCWILKDS